ncbi:MAG: DUF3068 domain-containing protein [Blastococcus sp.]
MRGRPIGLGLLALGAFLLAGALASVLFLAPALVKLPLAQTATPVAVDPHATYFNIGEQTQHQGDPVTVRQVVLGLPTAPGAGGDVAVWKFGQTVEDSGDLPITPNIAYQVCVDRKAAAAVDCSSSKILDDHGKKITGLTLTFPFDTQKKTYDVFDATAGKAFPARFTGTTTLRGVAVYTFEQTVPQSVVQTTDVTGLMAGNPGGPGVTADVVYDNERTIWVEPTSGVIVDIKEHPNLVFRGPDGTTGVTLLNGTFSGTPTTVGVNVDRAKKSHSQIAMVHTTLPLLLVGLGVVALISGALLARRPVAGAHADGAPETADEGADRTVGVQ